MTHPFFVKESSAKSGPRQGYHSSILANTGQDGDRVFEIHSVLFSWKQFSPKLVDRMLKFTKKMHLRVPPGHVVFLRSLTLNTRRYPVPSSAGQPVRFGGHQPIGVRLSYYYMDLAPSPLLLLLLLPLLPLLPLFPPYSPPLPLPLAAPTLSAAALHRLIYKCYQVALLLHVIKCKLHPWTPFFQAIFKI